jgi:Fic family protein
MRRFDYTFLGQGMVPASIANLTGAIREIKAMESGRIGLFPGMFSSLERIARVESVKGSNAIEGIVTTDQRIREIVNGNTAPLNHDEMEIAGYRDALDIVHSNYRTMQINGPTILELHKTMLSYTPQSGGAYKGADNVIMEVDTFGARRIRFTPVAAAETPAAMEQLILAYMSARSDSSINSLLLTPCLVLDFLCIHPFTDGNGRMSRLLSLLTLYKSGFDAGKYVSFEEQINSTKPRYYEALKMSSEGWHTNENSYFPFIEDFLTTLLICYRKLNERFDIVQGKRATKAERVEAAVLRSIKPISKKEISDLFPDISPTTIEAALGRMVRNGEIAKTGGARSTKYVKKIGQ